MATIVLQGTDTAGGAQNILANVLGSGGLFGMATTPYVNTGLLWVPQKSASDGSLVVAYPTAGSVWSNPSQAVVSGTPFVLATFATAGGAVLRGHFHSAVSGTLSFSWCESAAFSGAPVVTNPATTRTLAGGDDVAIENVNPLGAYGRITFAPTGTGAIGGGFLLRPN